MLWCRVCKSSSVEPFQAPHQLLTCFTSTTVQIRTPEELQTHTHTHIHTQTHTEAMCIYAGVRSASAEIIIYIINTYYMIGSELMECVKIVRNIELCMPNKARRLLHLTQALHLYCLVSQSLFLDAQQGG